jgi:hypothetical protein
MKNFLGFIAMFAWTLLAGVFLYLSEIFSLHTDILWAILIASILLLVHVINLILYFKITGDSPYKWKVYQ